jgi:hypothetical protein
MFWEGADALQSPNREAGEPRSIFHCLEADEFQRYLIQPRIASVPR